MPGSQVNTLYPTGGVANLETGLSKICRHPGGLVLPRKHRQSHKRAGHDQDLGGLDSKFVSGSKARWCTNRQEMVPFGDLVMLHRMEELPPGGRMEPSW